MTDWQEVLIDAVRQRPCLWYKRHPDYLDARGVKKNNWIDVAEVVAKHTNEPCTGE
jgi:hypothetical protein